MASPVANRKPPFVLPDSPSTCTETTFESPRKSKKAIITDPPITPVTSTLRNKENFPPRTRRANQTDDPATPPNSTKRITAKTRIVASKPNRRRVSLLRRQSSSPQARSPLVPKLTSSNNRLIPKKSTPEKPLFTAVEIITLDESGSVVSKEARSEHPISNKIAKSRPRLVRNAKKSICSNVSTSRSGDKDSGIATLDEDSSESEDFIPAKRRTGRPALTIISDDEDEGSSPAPSLLKSALNQAPNDGTMAKPSSRTSTVPRETHITTACPATASRESRPSSASSVNVDSLPQNSRRTTHTAVAQLSELHFPPHPLVDQVSDVSVVSSTVQIKALPATRVPSTLPLSAPLPSLSSAETTQVTSNELHRLLGECEQQSVLDFEQFVSSFPNDMSIGCPPKSSKYRKIGEASFSEVFALGDIVIKVIPMLPEDQAQRPLACDDLPQASPIADVEKEVVITRDMGNLHPGFIKLIKAFVVKGSYPAVLKTAWDAYDRIKGSDSIRPHDFPATTHYALIILPHGGIDLESYVFNQKSSWRACVSVFWQVVRALALAEEAVQFEHRDLHWGQVLIKNDPAQVGGVVATIIDLGFSRMQGPEATYFTEFDEETFEGKGDYQYDVYRMMRSHNGNDWTTFRPLTNVML
ncbi:hypothetical protein FRB99_005523 [Tulasnella sp. 403]|nr:hypothetical protein FRB99_005523 [Tulasnella sp. 403]